MTAWNYNGKNLLYEIQYNPALNETCQTLTYTDINHYTYTCQENTNGINMNNNGVVVTICDIFCGYTTGPYERTTGSYVSTTHVSPSIVQDDTHDPKTIVLGNG